MDNIVVSICTDI